MGDAASVAPAGLPLEVTHAVRPRSLPSLRYGHHYRLRLRVVDLAGNALPFDPERPSPQLAESNAVEYQRFEPLESPSIALVGSGAATGFPREGEDLATVAIRSLNATPALNTVPTKERAQRHVVPPLGSQKFAELHGMLDAAARLDPATYALLVARDRALADVAHPVTGQRVPAGEVGFALPFLPDPLARECVVRIYGRTSPASVELFRIDWYAGAAAWPDARPFRVEVLEVKNAAAKAPTFDATARVLHVPLAKADWVRVRVGHALRDESLALFGIWTWALARVPADPATRSRLTEMARSGQHWMLTPWRDIELVHAVQRPLVQPVIEGLQAARTRGDTAAKLWFSTPVDSRSTEKFDLAGRWNDPIDDPQAEKPQLHASRGHAAELKLLRLEAPGFEPPGRRTWTAQEPVTHHFADTRYRRVQYQLTATTRFTKFLPATLQAPERANELTVVSAEAVGLVPNASAPPAPDIVYVMPTFGWARSGNDREERSFRTGGGLRVYLRRPWLVTGYLEMLAVVLAPKGAADAKGALAHHVTEWGADPTWTADPVDGAAPATDRFPLAVRSGPIPADRLASVIPSDEGDVPVAFNLSVPLPGVPGQPTVDVVPHLVGWDDERKLWYADIVINTGTAFGPFIKLALARYQPISAAGAHLSPVATTEIVQLLADRMAVLTKTPARVYRVGLYGHAPAQRENRTVEFTIERLAADAQSDLAWDPLPGVTVVPATPGRKAKAHRPVGTLRPRPTPGEVAARASFARRIVSRESLRAEAHRLLAAGRFDEIAVRSDLVDLIRPPLIREVTLQVPRARERGERFRLVILEVELREADRDHAQSPPERDPRRRIVYAETIELV
ncbi:MAG: hypothetical protein NVS3B16_22010 [Vulcanimicrobiaceae bacterium]